ncbi:MAG TPA: 4Fe-4S binding protein [Rhodocyclaceae bacterium]
MLFLYPLIRTALVALLLLHGVGASAGSLNRSDIQQRFRAPLVVLDKLPDIAAWPIVNASLGGEQPVGYAFESVDFAPIPGYEGTPVNLLVVVDGNGYFWDVEVIEQHEPMFVFSGLGEGPLREYVKQYIGKGLTREILIASGGDDSRKLSTETGGQRDVIDGIAKATATVRIVHKSILSSALTVARAKLGLAGKDAHEAPAQPRSDVFERLSFAQLEKRGLVAHLQASNAAVENLFAGSEWAGLDSEGQADPAALQVDLYLAYLNAPTIGRSLLGDEGYRRLMEKLEPGQTALWIASRGRYSMLDDDFTPGGDSQRLALTQGGLPLEMRDLIFDLPATAAAVAAPPLAAARVFTVFAEAGLNPAKPLELSLFVRRAKGMVIPRVMQQPLKLGYQLPEELFSLPPPARPEWWPAWQSRAADIAVITVFLALLALLLARPRAVAARPRRLRAVRLASLAFTLGYIGWYAQGQLSVVQITGAIKALHAGQGLAILLYDPVSLLLIGFTVSSFQVWGRGTFCGWLCPFGALQEFVGLLARRLGVPQYRPPAQWLASFAWLRYGLLALLCLAAWFAPTFGGLLVEVEPFKTAITVGFERSWPYLAYAGLLLALGACYFKFFCRVLCPLGAAMALGGRLRRLDWLPRRAECGTPCQTCRARCDYDAIASDGAIEYAQCFQCLDCVGIYHDAQRCAPLLFHARTGRAMSIRPAPQVAPAAVGEAEAVR